MALILPFPTASAPWPDAASALTPVERTVLRALRLWVAAFRRGADPRPDVLAAMAEGGASGDAALSVDALLAVAARTARRPLDLRCPACPRLSDDEATLLHAAALAQRGDTEGAESALRPLLSDAGASFAVGPLEGLGTLLGAARQRLPLRLPPTAAEANARSRIEAWAPPAGPLH
jgi:hypothetical protein